MDSVHFRSIALPDKQFWARDNLANERTYLAWLKTSLVFVSVGIALAQFDKFLEGSSVIVIGGFEILLKGNLSESKRPLGAICVILGILVLIIGTFRFYYTQTKVLQKQFPVANFSAVFLAFATIVCVTFFFASALKV